MFGRSAGHITDMISKLKACRDQLKRKHFRKDEDGFIYFGSPQLELKFKEGSKADKQRIIKQIKADIKHQRRLATGMLVLSVVLTIVAFAWFARNLI